MIRGRATSQERAPTKADALASIQRQPRLRRRRRARSRVRCWPRSYCPNRSPYRRWHCCIGAASWGTVALGARHRAGARLLGSDGAGEFGERVRDAPMRARVHAKFVVAAPDVLHQRMTAHDHTRVPVPFETSHWSQPRLEPAVVSFEPIVRLLVRVMERAGREFVDCSGERRRLIGHDLGRLAVRGERRGEEPARGAEIASG